MASENNGSSFNQDQLLSSVMLFVKEQKLSDDMWKVLTQVTMTTRDSEVRKESDMSDWFVYMNHQHEGEPPQKEEKLASNSYQNPINPDISNQLTSEKNKNTKLTVPNANRNQQERLYEGSKSANNLLLDKRVSMEVSDSQEQTKGNIKLSDPRLRCYLEDSNQSNLSFSSNKTSATFNARLLQKTKIMSEQYLLKFFKCPIPKCMFSTDTKNEFSKHLLGHSRQEVKCVYCSKCYVASHADEVADHMQNVHGLRIFQCALCRYRAISEVHVQRHQKDNHGGGGMIFQCEKVFGGTAPFSDLAAFPRLKRKPFLCKFMGCDFQSELGALFEQHTVSKHKNVGVYRCGYCKEQQRTLSQLFKHKMLFHKMHHYYCNYCDQGFASFDMVLKHTANDHPDFPMPFNMSEDSKSPKIIPENPCKSLSKSFDESLSDSSGPSVVCLRSSVYSKPKTDIMLPLPAFSREKSLLADDSRRSESPLQLHIQEMASNGSGNHLATDSPSEELLKEIEALDHLEASLKNDSQNHSTESQDKEVEHSFYKGKCKISTLNSNDLSEFPTTVYHCITCDTRNISFSQMKDHLHQYHHQQIVIKCGWCPSFGNEHEDFTVHMESFHPEQEPKFYYLENTSQTLACDRNGSTSSQAVNGTIHKDLRISVRKNFVGICRLCTSSFQKLRVLMSHVKQNHQNQLCIFSCGYCKSSTKNVGEATVHCLEQHPEKKGCKIIVRTKCRKKKSKIKQNSGDINLPLIKDPLNPEHVSKSNFLPVFCPFCGSSFSASEIRPHLFAELSYQPYTCMLCDFSCLESSEIQDHMSDHCSDNRQEYKVCKDISCETWVENYIKMQQQDTELRIPISCSSKYPLSLGQIESKGVFKCPFCVYESTRELLKNHFCGHLDYIPYACKYCKYKAMSQKCVLDHVHQKHVDKTPSYRTQRVSALDAWLGQLFSGTKDKAASASSSGAIHKAKLSNLERSLLASGNEATKNNRNLTENGNGEVNGGDSEIEKCVASVGSRLMPNIEDLNLSTSFPLDDTTKQHWTEEKVLDGTADSVTGRNVPPDVSKANLDDRSAVGKDSTECHIGRQEPSSQQKAKVLQSSNDEITMKQDQNKMNPHSYDLHHQKAEPETFTKRSLSESNPVPPIFCDTPEISGQFKCAYCNEGPGPLSLLRDHHTLHHHPMDFRLKRIIENGSKKLICFYCFVEVPSFAELKRHSKSVHPQRLVKCRCPKKPKEGMKEPVKQSITSHLENLTVRAQVREMNVDVNVPISLLVRYVNIYPKLVLKKLPNTY